MKNQDIKALVNENNKQGFEYAEARIKKFAGAVVKHLSILNDNFKDTKSAIVNNRTSTEVIKSLNEIKANYIKLTLFIVIFLEKGVFISIVFVLCVIFALFYKKNDLRYEDPRKNLRSKIAEDQSHQVATL